MITREQVRGYLAEIRTISGVLNDREALRLTEKLIFDAYEEIRRDELRSGTPLEIAQGDIDYLESWLEDAAQSLEDLKGDTRFSLPHLSQDSLSLVEGIVTSKVEVPTLRTLAHDLGEHWEWADLGEEYRQRRDTLRERAHRLASPLDYAELVCRIYDLSAEKIKSREDAGKKTLEMDLILERLQRSGLLDPQTQRQAETWKRLGVGGLNLKPESLAQTRRRQLADWEHYRDTIFGFKDYIREKGTAGPLDAAGRRVWAFAIITASNPKGLKCSASVNAALNLRLTQKLEKLSEPRIEVSGGSADGKHFEPGWAVALPKPEAIAWGKEFGQQAIYWIEGDQLWLVPCWSDFPEEKIAIWKERVL